MSLNTYMFRFVVGVTAFVFGIGLFNFGQYFKELSKTEKKEVAAVQPITTQLKTAPTPPVVEVSVEQTISTVESEEKPVYEFDAGGDYYIIGDLPEGFKDFEGLSITTKNYENASAENDYAGVPVPPEGYIYMKKEFKFVRINIADKQISFETEDVRGISYQFVGEFIEEEEIKNGEYSDYAVLKGRLSKMKNGLKIAESEVKFAYAHGC